MKKLVAVAPDRVEVVEVDMPVMGEDEVLVRGVRSLLSPGSELKRVRRWDYAYPKRAWPNEDLGYAMAGVVEDVGSKVRALKPGDRVITMGHHQQFVVGGEPTSLGRVAIPLPDDIGWDAAPFACWSQSCINWMHRADILHSENVAVVGCGLVGLLMTMWSRLSNPRSIIAVDLFDKRLELAKKAGADVVLNGRDVDAVKEVQGRTGGGSDVTLHCVGGAAVKSFEASQRMTRPGGRIVLIGHHSEDTVVLPHQLTGKDLLGASVGYVHDPRLFVDGIRLMQAGKLPVADIVTHRVPYTEAPRIYDMLIKSPEEAGAVQLEW